MLQDPTGEKLSAKCKGPFKITKDHSNGTITICHKNNVFQCVNKAYKAVLPEIINTGLFYINKFLSEMTPFGDDDIGSFTQVTPQHVEGDNLEKIMNGFYCWLDKTAFRIKLNTWLSTDKKMQYQKYAKQVIRERFPDHHLFSDRYIEWHNDIVKAFKRQCDRSRQLDENINEERKSQPLHPDVEGRGKPIAIRAKYLRTKIYDCRRVATN